MNGEHDEEKSNTMRWLPIDNRVNGDRGQWEWNTRNT